MTFFALMTMGLIGCSETEKDSGEEQQEQQEEVFAPTAGDWVLLATPTTTNGCEFEEEETLALLALTDDGFTFLVDKEDEEDGVPHFNCTVAEMNFTCDQISIEEPAEGWIQTIDFSGSFSDGDSMTGTASIILLFGDDGCETALDISGTAVH